MVFSRFGLRIAAWNANGVRSRIVELRDFINKHSLDIILLQESHLRPGVSIRVPNYTLYRNDRETQNIYHLEALRFLSNPLSSIITFQHHLSGRLKLRS
ncbi:hypothetical protein TNCV_1942151 [Trichonephila clavipes]|uniref:Endonuclease/exonuclease/phosphatase domain-containing protein n=1 Tax=Trichonephila clavipes TaxID=2585209 RepID=A0A8X6SDT0_TRICX|nr:hypothetical protein TNCV_1942151 [Trichonephila clavipes]